MNFWPLYDAKADVTGGDLKRGLSTVRWRLAIGLASLAATVVLTVPAGVAREVGREASVVGANSLTQVADVIWPNDPEFVISDLIWPNLVQVSELAGLTFD